MPKHALALLAAIATASTLAAAPLPQAGDAPGPASLDLETDCNSLMPPAAISLPLFDDTTTRIRLEVRVLIDTVETPTIIALRSGDAADQHQATVMFDGLVDEVAPLLDGIDDAFDPLSIDVALSYDVLTTYDAQPSSTVELIQAGKDQYGGATPKGVDVVYVATENLTEGTTAGQADCVGGLKSDHHSFAAGKFDRGYPPFEFVPGVKMIANPAAGVFAHEVGHILGAHHHMMNCGESAARYPATEDALAVCTLMVNDIGLAQRTFSSANSLVVRGYADDFADDSVDG